MIHPGKRITDDYGYLNIPYPFRAIDEGTRRNVVYPNDLLKYYKVWDNKIKKVFPKIPRVEQALKPVLPDSTWERIQNVISGEEEMESILSNYYEHGG